MPDVEHRERGGELSSSRIVADRLERVLIPSHGLQHRRPDRALDRPRSPTGRPSSAMASASPTRSSRSARTGSPTTSPTNGVAQGPTSGSTRYNSIEFVETMLAAFKLRAVPININYRYTADELRYIFDNADLVALVHQRRSRRSSTRCSPTAPLLKHVVVIEDGTDETYDARRIRGRARRLVPERDFERPLRRRPLHPLHRRHDGHAEGRRLPARGRLARARRRHRLPRPANAIDDEWHAGEERRPTAPAGGVSFPIAPLMHGAAQWGTLGAPLQRQHGRPHPEVRPARGLEARRAREGQHDRGDGRRDGASDGRSAARGELRHVVARRVLEHGRRLLAVASRTSTSSCSRT